MTALGLALLAVAVVLAVSGATKLPARQQTEDAFEALRIPVVPRRFGAAVLPWAELALAVALVALRGPLLVVAALFALGLSLVYTAVIARALGFAEPVTCSCFGRFGAARVSRLTLARNLVLSLVAALAVWGAADGQQVWGLVTGSLPWVVVATLVAALFALVAAGSGTVEAGSAWGDQADALDYLRLPIPYAQLRSGEETTTLRDLARQQARLVVLLSSGCGSCRRTAERLDAWAEQLDPAVGIVPVYTYDPGDVPHRAPWYLQPEGNVGHVLEMYGTPSAVLLGADGMLAGGPITGEDSVARFVDEILEQLHGGLATDAEPVIAEPILDEVG